MLFRRQVVRGLIQVKQRTPIELERWMKMETLYMILWVSVSTIFVLIAAICIGIYFDSKQEKYDHDFDDVERIKKVMKEGE